jgi:glycolate oxidase FAD binding subunit
MQETIDRIAEILRRAYAEGTPLNIEGGGTKRFYGGPGTGETLNVSAYRGIVDYEPSELVLTARCGTPLKEVEAALAQQGQMLPFEPPHFGEGATLGGCVAAGLSGPRRAASGAVRDYVLGVRMLDGRGSDLSFGGRVMKNVAGYDVSRLMAGSLGTLGVILEVSLKVLPRPRTERTLRLEMDETRAIEAMNALAGKPLPISATFHHEGLLWVRLSGAESAIRAARSKIGGEEVPEGEAFWTSVREQTHPFFASCPRLWRLSIKSTTPPLALGPQAMEWGGALRWIARDAPAAEIRAAAQRSGGHATLFRGADGTTPVFHPLPAALERIHRRLKQAFDPAGILNPGRLYPGM